jgi:hypothetical protein
MANENVSSSVILEPRKRKKLRELRASMQIGGSTNLIKGSNDSYRGNSLSKISKKCNYMNKNPFSFGKGPSSSLEKYFKPVLLSSKGGSGSGSYIKRDLREDMASSICGGGVYNAFGSTKDHGENTIS